jgi:hypothetical protein
MNSEQWTERDDQMRVQGDNTHYSEAWGTCRAFVQYTSWPYFPAFDGRISFSSGLSSGLPVVDLMQEWHRISHR